MNEKIVLENAFVLHARPYRETSLLLDFFTKSFGRISAIAKGARSAKSTKKSILQPFRSISISTVGRTDLKTLTDVELTKASVQLTGDRLFSAMYINELLYHALPKYDPHAQLFMRYQALIQQLSCVSVEIEPVLRQFEMQLLSELGYAISLSKDAHSGENILSESHYLFTPGHGFTQTTITGKSKNPFLFLGAHLLSLDQNELLEIEVLKSAKRLMRLALAELLGEKAINSKKLFAVKTED